MAITAVQHIRRMRGGAQSHLMLAADENLYVVKFQNNPQHVRVLANELLATRVAETLGLTVPGCEIVEVSPWLIENTSELRVETPQGTAPCAAGLQFGSKLVGGLMPGRLVDYLAAEQLLEVRNLREFAGMLVLDKWLGNANGRQAVFQRKARERKYKAVFIDHGYCFGAGEWAFHDSPLRGVYGRNAVYEFITGWEDFEPWLTNAEEFSARKLWEAANEAPPEWYGHASEELEQLVARLMSRRGRVREMIETFRLSSRNPFPKWGMKDADAENTLQAWMPPLGNAAQ